MFISDSEGSSKGTVNNSIERTVSESIRIFNREEKGLIVECIEGVLVGIARGESNDIGVLEYKFDNDIEYISKNDSFHEIISEVI